MTSEEQAGRLDKPTGQTLTVPVIQEELVTGTERVQTGSVRVTKEVVEEEMQLNVTATSEEVSVVRKEINKYIDVAPEAVRQEGDVTIISVVKEVLVVEKRLMLVEELHITKNTRVEEKTISEKIRKEVVTVSRDSSGTTI